MSFLAALALISNAYGTEILPPSQPATGPGGAEYKFAGQDQGQARGMTERKFGEGNSEYWIFEPGPEVKKAPVILFLHGWGGMNPKAYRGWIEHLVRRGNIVIYPRYQKSLLVSLRNMTDYALDAVKSGFEVLGERADRSRVALVGHSLGGQIIVNLAARAQAAGLPKPTALFAVEPGGGIRLETEGIPRDLLVVALAGEDDRVVGQRGAKRIFESLSQIPAKNRALLLMQSDLHGDHNLVADHFAPLSGGRHSDALDFYGLWKTFDALTAAAFEGRGLELQLSMGAWSDGVAVKPLVRLR